MTRRISRLFIVWLALVALAACARAPDEAAVRETVSQRLASNFDDSVLRVESLRRLGSAPMSAASDGASRTIVYYNAVLELQRDFAFNDWDALNPSALAALLGASTRGITGIRPQGNQAGDELRVRGSVTYRQEPDGWQPVATVLPPPSPAPALESTGSGTARSIVNRIVGLLEHAPVEQRQTRAIINEELQTAYRQITLRLDRLQRVFLVAGGPEGGEYDRLAAVVAAFKNGQGVPSAHVQTEGSHENLRLLTTGRADVALVQNDVAERYLRDHGPIDAPNAIRALGSLFPEPLHVVVRADSELHSLDDLRGQRVDLGFPGSGTRRTFEAVMAANGLTVEDFAVVSERGGVAAAQALRQGELDAFAAVINAPVRFIQELAADTGIRLLPVTAGEGELGDTLVEVSLPQGTYPGQMQAVSTLAVAALLVVRADLPDADARSLIDAVYEDIDFPASGSNAGGQINRGTANVGVSIPLHPAALQLPADALPQPDLDGDGLP